MNFNGLGIGLASIVHITAGEAFRRQPGAPSSILVGPNGQTLHHDFDYHVGDANISVSNVSPHAGGVEYILNVDWPEQLGVAVTITVEDQIPDAIQMYGE